MTSPAYWHLALNHVPVLGALFSLLLLAWAGRSRSSELVTAAMGAAVMAGLMAIPAYLTGDGAEDVVKHLPGIETHRIDEHEEAAVYALSAAIAMGVLAGAGLATARARPGLFKIFYRLTLAAAVLATLIMLRTAHLGGQIRHSEISGAGQPSEGHDESE